jgi:hypothetical protein
MNSDTISLSIEEQIVRCQLNGLGKKGEENNSIRAKSKAKIPAINKSPE